MQKIDCNVCGGSGELTCDDCDNMGIYCNDWGVWQDCNYCGGTCKRKCKHCKGTGKLEVAEGTKRVFQIGDCYTQLGEKSNTLTTWMIVGLAAAHYTIETLDGRQRNMHISDMEAIVVGFYGWRKATPQEAIEFLTAKREQIETDRQRLFDLDTQLVFALLNANIAKKQDELEV